MYVGLYVICSPLPAAYTSAEMGNKVSNELVSSQSLTAFRRSVEMFVSFVRHFVQRCSPLGVHMVGLFRDCFNMIRKLRPNAEFNV
jgi:hypothetical protein